MKEVHVAVTKKINGKHIVADVELDPEQMESIPPWEQSHVLLTAFNTAKSALWDKEVEAVCEEIKNLVPCAKRKKKTIKAT